MMNEQTLPLQILKVACDLFAGPSTGFSGPELLDFFAQYSRKIMPYPWAGGALSRRQMFEESLKQLPAEQQRQALLDLCDYDGPMKYSAPSPMDRRGLRTLVVGADVPSTALTQPVLTRIDWAMVNKDWQRASKQLEVDPEGAITAIRSLVESVCKHILENLDISYRDDGDLGKLYKATARSLRLAPDQHTEEVFRQVLGGCVSIVGGLAGLRNVLGDSHGKGIKYVAPSPRHAKLAVAVGGAVAMFLIETYLARVSFSPQIRD